MDKQATNRQPVSAETGEPSYWTASRKPLQILVFLLPLIILYELGLVLLLRTESGIITNKAHESLLRFFVAFGVNATGGLFLGGIAIVVVLFIWHLLTKDSWRVELETTGLMGLESIVLILPLLVLGRIVRQTAIMTQAPGGHDLFELMALSGPTGLADLGLWSGMAISVGAGLYEELLFRMMMIAALHTLLVDLGRMPHRLGAGIALVVSSIAFALYHRDPALGLSMQKFVFYFLAGLYFGVIYLIRGFGIVVAVHAFYDILTVAVMQEQASP